jgi:hypothetical protein
MSSFQSFFGKEAKNPQEIVYRRRMILFYFDFL